MRANQLTPLIAATALCIAIASPIAATAKKRAEPTDHKHNKSIEQELGPLREELDALRQSIAVIEAEQANSETSELNTLRIAVVVMGIGMAGGLFRLRQMGQQIKQLKEQQ